MLFVIFALFYTCYDLEECKKLLLASKIDFDQQTVYGGSICWSKYTAIVCVSPSSHSVNETNFKFQILTKNIFSAILIKILNYVPSCDILNTICILSKQFYDLINSPDIRLSIKIGRGKILFGKHSGLIMTLCTFAIALKFPSWCFLMLNCDFLGKGCPILV